jgi:hypothetical protein
LLWSVVFAAGARPAGAVTVTLQPQQGAGIDTYIQSGDDSLLNFGADDKLVVGDEGEIDRALVRFDLSSLGSVTQLKSATLDLFLDNESGPGTPANIGVFAITRPWTEGTGDGTPTLDGATWTRATGFTGWSAAGGDFDSAAISSVIVPETKDRWYSWDVTAHILAALADSTKNRGMLLKLIPEIKGEGIRREFVSNDRNKTGPLPKLTLDIVSVAPAAVDSARAEIVPRTAVAGGTELYTYTIRTFAGPGTTGVNSIRIPLGTGFTLVALTTVLVDSLPRIFTSTSDSTTIRVGLSSKVTGSRRIDIGFTAVAPLAGTAAPVEFPAFVDDAVTTFPPNAATEGIANLDDSDGNLWRVLLGAPTTIGIQIVPDSATVSADSTYDFDAIALDLLGGSTPIEPQWSVSGGIGTIGAAGVFNATTTGSGYVVAVSGVLRDSALVRVVPGAPASIDVTPDLATVSADTSQPFSAAVRDSDGNLVPTSPAWSVVGAIGTVSGAGLFDATTSGVGFVRATAGAARDSSAVTVVSGTAVSLVVTPDSASVSADSTRLFVATAHDADGNVAAYTPKWSVRGGIGSVSDGLFIATTAGQGWVVASPPLGIDSVGIGDPGVAAQAKGPSAAPLADSARVTVTPGALARIVVAPATATVSADSSLAFSAAGFDADGNALGAVLPVWSVSGAIGSITTAGLFSPATAGSGGIVARQSGGSIADTADVTVVAGALNSVAVSPSSGLVSPGDTIQFHLSGFDKFGNAVTIPPSAVEWSTSDASGSITTSGLYTAGTSLSPPVWSVTGKSGNLSASAPITILSSGTLSRIEIVDTLGAPVGALALTADADGLVLRAEGFGSAGESLGPVACAWSVVGNAAVAAAAAGPDVATSVDFMQVGSVRIRAAAGGLADTTGEIAVSAGAVASIGVAPGPLTVTTDTTLLFTASPLDEDGNAAAAGAITWSVTGGIGTVAQTGLFDPTTAGTGTIRAASSLGAAGDSPTITVTAGAAAQVVVSPSSAIVAKGSTRQFAAAVTDADDSAVPGAVAWSATGGVGVVDANGLFTGSAGGSGAVVAASGSFADTASVTVTEPGLLAVRSVRVPRLTVTEGQSGIPLTIRFRNDTGVTLTDFTADIRPRTPQGADLSGSVALLAAAAPDSAPAGSDASMTLTIGLEPTALAGAQIILDASLLAASATGVAFYDSTSDTTATWVVQAPPRLVDARNSVWPRRVVRGASSVALLLGGSNDGGVALTLDPSVTRLSFGGGGAAYSSPLAAPATLAADSSLAVLSFAGAGVPAAIAEGDYPLTLALAGTDANGKAYAETLTTVDRNEVSVIPPYVTVTPVAVAGGSARPGETGRALLAFDLENGYPDAKTLASVALTNGTIGPGSTSERDAEIAAVALYWDRDGDGDVSAADTLVGVGAFASGRATLTTGALVIPAETTARFVAAVSAALGARDGDSLDAALDTAGDLAFAESPTIDGVFPINSTGRLAVDGAAAAQFATTAIASRAIAPGESLVAALDVTVPANGYEADTLRAFSVAQLGTALAGGDIARVRLARRTAAAASAASTGAAAGTHADSIVGDMVWSGARWTLTGAALAVPPGGARVAVLVDIAPNAALGRTVALALPAGEGAVAVASANDGPLDAAVGAGGTLTVGSPDRIVVSASAASALELPQGARDVPLLAMTLTNGYATTRSLTGLSLSLEGAARDPLRLDAALDSVALYVDANRSGSVDAGDTRIGARAIANGRAAFGPFALPLPPDESADLLATGFVAATARDGDSLRLVIASAPSLAFDAASAVSGVFPAAGGTLLPISGMTHATVANHGAPPRTLVPGETKVLVLDATVPANGYEPDTLRSVRVENAGTAADASDIAALWLYRDGGDGLFDAGAGDDALVGAPSFVGSGWLLDGLGLPLPEGGVRLFAAVDVAGAPDDSATLVGTIPLGGLAVASSNDGPIDAAVVNPFAQTISTSPLVVAVDPDRLTASVGQTLGLSLVVRNVGDAAIDGIAPSLVGPSGTGAATLLTGPTPDSLSLAPRDSARFVWSLRADAAGVVDFTGSARGRDASSGAPISATPIAARSLSIVNAPSEVSLFPTDLAPPTAARGAEDVVPLSITFSTSGPPPAGSALVRWIALALDDGQGNPVSAAALLSRVRVREAGMLFHETTALGDSAVVPLALATPIALSSENPVTASIAFDIRPQTQVPAFRVRIVSADAIGAVDANSGAPVPVVLETGGGLFPVVTGTTLVIETPSELVVSVDEEGLQSAAVNRGQTGVRALRLHLRSVGDSTVATDVRVVDVAFAVGDSSGIASDAALLSRVTIADQQIVYADRASPILEGGTLRVALATPILLPVNTEVTADVTVAIAAGTSQRQVRFRIADAHRPSARDAASGAPVPVRLVGPFEGSLLRVESRPPALAARAQPLAGRAVYPGTAGVALARLAFRHAGAAEEASIVVSSLRVRATDDLGNPQALGTRLLSVSAVRSASTIGSANVAENLSPSATVPLSTPVLLAPGDSAEVELRATVRGVAAPGRVRLWIDGDGIAASDANEGAAVALAASDVPPPFGSAILSVLAPPADPIASFRDRTPATVARGAHAVPVAFVSVTNPDGDDAGSIDVASIRLGLEDATGAPLNPAALFAETRALDGAAVAASGAGGAADRLVLDPPRAIAPGETLVLAIEADLLDAPAASGFRVTLADSAIAIARPGDGIAAPAVRAAAGESFPFATGRVGIIAPAFIGSVSNYPNPFAAGREETRFLFHLPEPALIDIAIYTALGEPVATVARALRFGAGTIAPLAWDGRNADGEVVLSGVYLAEVRVRYDSGRSESALRKVAVLR